MMLIPLWSTLHAYTSHTHTHTHTLTHTHTHSPCSLYQNPLRVDSVEVKESYALDANEVLVVYQRNRDTGGVERRVQNGPTVFTPSADEWSVNCVTLSPSLLPLLHFTCLCCPHPPGSMSLCGTGQTPTTKPRRFPKPSGSPSCVSFPTSSTSTSKT